MRNDFERELFMNLCIGLKNMLDHPTRKLTKGKSHLVTGHSEPPTAANTKKTATDLIPSRPETAEVETQYQRFNKKEYIESLKE